ncbi:hypothetical protein CRE_09814 [Caenorhabditis remanei]|uniref:F-box domain-containing protein n=1 Tax=Caenorhabditis remanei TaxID=31234 RepID=E3NDG4_CAERE|nr:hypothetical protein CRE_09814 [Caenorhabditis remanei]
MNPPNPFPILHLPFLAIEEVFKAMHSFEIIKFSLITKRTKAVAMQMTFLPRYSIQLNIQSRNRLEVCVVGPKYRTICCYSFLSDEKMDGEVVESDRADCYEIYACKYSINPVEGWKQFCKHVLEIFKKQTVNVLTLYMDAFVDHNVSFIDFLKTNVKSVTECNLDQSDEKNNVDEHAAYFLKNITVTNELISFLHHKNAYFNGKFPKHLKKLFIKNSEWIGYEKLLEIDCEHVVLKQNRITNEEWNMFLKKWMAMETHSNLKNLEVNYRELEEFRALVLHDIPHEVVDGGVKRVIKTRCRETYEITGGVDIRRIDGKTATFFVYRDFHFAMNIH